MQNRQWKANERFNTTDCGAGIRVLYNPLFAGGSTPYLLGCSMETHPCRITGIHLPYLYVGTCSSRFNWHMQNRQWKAIECFNTTDRGSAPYLLGCSVDSHPCRITCIHIPYLYMDTCSLRFNWHRKINDSLLWIISMGRDWILKNNPLFREGLTPYLLGCSVETHPCRITGIHIPYLYVGTCSSRFNWHRKIMTCYLQVNHCYTLKTECCVE